MKPFDKLKTKLAELFQLDQADLDFGIYRIMNAKREEITRFLEKDLLPQVQSAFQQYRSSDKGEIQKELDKSIKDAQALGVDPDTVPKVKELRARYESSVVDIAALENEVYDHLYSFFSRYYDEGDFISMRRYKEGVYAIPYEGEEVKLYWANHDQYYIKTTENFRDYTFKLPDGRNVHFKIVAADTEKDNVKAANGKDRRFILHDDHPVSEEKGELIVSFEYRPDPEKRKQDDFNRETATTILTAKGIDPLWVTALTQTWRRADGTISEKTILEKHLYDYTRRNTFDYFIHKDLGRFLRRELDFYIKNEVMHLDDVENESAPRVEQYLSKIKVIRRISNKIIDFLAQIEDFQKKLWLKKKFVVETNYCVTLDRVPEELYPEIVANDTQREEWIRLFAIDEISADLAGKVAYSNPLTVAFLKANKNLLLDTKFFNLEFRDKLMSGFADIDETCNSLLIHSENLQALNLLQNRYHGQVQCVHIDPPYNTSSSGFLYKNEFQHSSWLSLMRDRCILGFDFLKKYGVFACHIDEQEMEKLHLILDQSYMMNAGTLVWDKGMPTAGANGLATQHEYVLFRTKGNSLIRVKKKNIDLIHQKIGELLKYFGAPSKNAISEYRKWLRSRNDFTKAELTYNEFDETGKAFRSDNMSATDRRTHNKFYIPLKHHLTGLDCPVPEYGWRYTPESIQKLQQENLILFGEDHSIMPRKKTYIENTSDSQMSTVYRSGSRGKVLLDNLNLEFPFAHAVDFYSHIISASSDFNDLIIDFFGGSGTTGHATINLNREEKGNRKYILVEMGDYFDTVLKPRIQKVVYAKEWKDGKPVSRNTGVSHMFKYLRLESYEDALANLRLHRTDAQQSLLDQSESFRESYMLSYMLDMETKDSSSLLNIDCFDDPFSYQLHIGTGSVGETKPITVDLVETFNWLLGLKVRHMDVIEGFRIVEGVNPKGEKALVIWRKIRDLAETDADKIQESRKKTNEDLEAFFRKQQYNTMDMEFDVIYVNGDNNLMNLPMAPEGEGLEPRYKVRLIEEEFKRLMFDVKDV